MINEVMQFGMTTVKKQKMQKTLLTTRLKAKARVAIISTFPRVKQLYFEPPNRLKSIMNILCLDTYLSFA